MPEDVVVRPEPVQLRLSVNAPTILMKSNLWYVWAMIAIAHEAESLAHRAEWKSGKQNIEPEYHASLVTAVAVAFTFDALHAELAPIVGRDADPQVRGKVWSYMRETIAKACSPPKGWRTEFEWLFRELRPQAVHSRPQTHQPIWHEGLQTNLTRENHLFSAESCTRAVDLMMNVFTALLGDSSKVDPAVQQWAAERLHVLDRFRTLRTAATR